MAEPEAPARFVERIPFGLGPGLYAASVNKFYIDELYLAVFARGGVQLGNALWWFDANVIDGVVNGAGWLSQRYRLHPAAHPDRRTQNYGLGIASGLVLVLIAYLVMRP